MVAANDVYIQMAVARVLLVHLTCALHMVVAGVVSTQMGATRVL